MVESQSFQYTINVNVHKAVVSVCNGH